VLTELLEKKALTPEVEKKIREVLDKFKDQFVAEEK